jgi:hypothetical protein
MADLIELFPGKKGEQSDQEAPVRTCGRDLEAEPSCRHMRVELHHESRRVYCVDCGREVPAFDHLIKLAGEWEKYKHHRDRARADAKRAQARLDDIKRQEANAKSRLRSGRKRLTSADPVWGRVDALLRSPYRYVTVDALREALYGDEPQGTTEMPERAA